jgi:hypothetical protein
MCGLVKVLISACLVAFVNVAQTDDVDAAIQSHNDTLMMVKPLANEGHMLFGGAPLQCKNLKARVGGWLGPCLCADAYTFDTVSECEQYVSNLPVDSCSRKQNLSCSSICLDRADAACWLLKGNF